MFCRHPTKWRRRPPTAGSASTTETVRADGKLRIELVTGYDYSGGPRTWADRQRWSLEDKLGDVLTEIDARTRLTQERERAAEEARAQRRRDWEAAMATARERVRNNHRITALNAQVKASEQTARIRSYCDALDKAIANNPALDDHVGQWLAWSRAYADRLDPIGRDDLEPAEAEPRREDLRPYLGRWCPYGPDER